MGYGIDNASGLDIFTWAQRMGLNPWHVAQLGDPSSTGGLRVNSSCNTLMYQRGANDAQRIGRRDVMQAIETAEQRLFDYARTWPSPRYTVREFQYPQLAQTALTRAYDIETRGRWLSVTLDEANIQALGAQTLTGLDTFDVAYTDTDNDGYAETATVIATVPSGTTADEVVIQFSDADIGSIAPAPRIAPRRVSVANTTAVIILDSWALVRPVLTAGWGVYNGTSGMLNCTVLPPDVNAPFASTVDVGRERCDPTGTTDDTAQALLIYETRPCPYPIGWCCGDTSSTDPSATRTVIARATLRDARAGIVAIGEATYDATTGTWSSLCCNSALDWRCYPPDRVVLRYCAGVPRVDTRMNELWSTTVARFASATLTGEICGCQAAQREIAWWQFDTSRTAGTSDAFQASPFFGNPFGSRRGEIDAWQLVQRNQRLVGMIAG